MLGLLHFSVRYPRLVLAISLLLTAVCLCGVPLVRPRLDARSLIPAGDPAMVPGDAATRLFDVHDMVVVAVAAPGGTIYSPPALALLAALGSDLARVEGIVPASVVSLATVPRLYLDHDLLDLRPWLERGAPDPLLAQRLRAETSALGLDDGVLAARDGRAAAIYAAVEPEADRPRLARRVRAVVARHATAGFPVYASGTAMAQAVLGEAAAADLVRLVPLVIVVLAAVLMFAFRHPAPAFVALLEVGLSQIWTIGIMGFRHEAVFVSTLVLPVILIVLGMTDDIYALHGYFTAARQLPRRSTAELIVETFGEVRMPILFTTITTITGLASIALTRLEPQRVFGVYGALSVLFSSLGTFTLVPALLVLLDPRPGAGRVPFARASQRLLERLAAALSAIDARWVLAALAVVAAAAAGLAASRLRIQDNWIGNLPPESDTVRGDRAINRLLAGTNTLDLMFDSGRRDGFLDPATLRALGAVEDDLAADPRVGTAVSAYDDVVRVDAALAGVDERAFRAALGRGERTLTPTDVEQAVMLISSARRAPGGQRLDGAYRRSCMTLFVRSANYTRIGALLGAAERATRRRFGGAVSMTPFGDGWISWLTVKLLVVGQVRSIGFALLAEIGLLLLLFRSVKTMALAVLPVAGCVVLVFGTLAGCGIPLGTANSMFAAITLGIGVSYSINLVVSYRDRERLGAEPRQAILSALADRGPAILLSCLAFVAGFSVMLLSAVPPNRQLGLLVCLSLASCMVITLVLVPSLTLVRNRRPRAAAAGAAGAGAGSCSGA